MKKVLFAVLSLCLFATISAVPAFASNILYSNGPGNFHLDGFGIGAVNGIANSFTLANNSTLTGATLGLWMYPDDTLASLGWAIGSDAVGTTIYGSGTSIPSDSLLFNTGFYDIHDVALSIPNLSLASGTYWLLIGNATTTGGGPAYWDENDGPSAAYAPWYGDMSNIDVPNSTGSETFSILGPTAVTPEPSTIALLGTGMLGLVGVSRRKLATA